METKTLIPRLKRIEGQVRGLQHMVEQGESCQDILTQLMIARDGLERVGQIQIAGSREPLAGSTGLLAASC
ncbi:MAG: metal-sensitive transcriptional regulator [Chloroflexi bacterium]|nr:metal-sensitive transcriptional regulator [Chloroflexota bacterium]